MIVVLLGLFATGCSAGATEPHPIAVPFHTESLTKGRAVPAKLQNQEKWVLVDHQVVAGKFERMTWHKLADRDHPEKWSESFEYDDMPRVPLSPRRFLDFEKQSYAKQCPSGTVTPIAVSDTELTVETKPCGPLGEQDEIDRFMFGKQDTFDVTYIVTAAEMISAQREQGLAALAAWMFQQSK